MTQSNSELLALIAQLQADLSAAKAAKGRSLSLKVSEKGAVSLYGMGRFPVTLYGAQWERLLNEADTIKAFLVANAALLSVKTEKPTKSGVSWAQSDEDSLFKGVK